MRGKQAKKRVVTPDSKYNSQVISSFINYVMLDGKKHVATDLVYRALEAIDLKALKPNVKEEKASAEGKGKGAAADKPEAIKLTPLSVFEVALNNIKPTLEIRSRRIGGANYQVPVPVSPDRQQALAMRWILSAARDGRKATDFSVALRHEIEQAFKGEGSAVKKKEDTQKMAEANRAFAQFA